MTPYPDRVQVVQLIQRAQAQGARLYKCCNTIGLCQRTYNRWLGENKEVLEDRRPGAERPKPANALTPEEKQAIVAVTKEPRFQSKPPSQIVPILADEGRYLASESTYYRILHENDLQHHRGRTSKPREALPRPSHEVTKPNETWAWDVTYLPSSVAGRWFYLYLIHDLFSRKIVGWEVNLVESGELAASLLTKAYLSEGVQCGELTLHSDNGSPMKAATMVARMEHLGVAQSLSRPSVSNDNATAEALFRTLKYTPSYPHKPFQSIEQSRQWVANFVCWYNTEHRHSAINFVTPKQRHDAEHIELLERRHDVYQAAREVNPQRWSAQTRDWTPVAGVHVNRPKTEGTKVAVLG